MESVQVPLLSQSSPVASPQRPKPEHHTVTIIEGIAKTETQTQVQTFNEDEYNRFGLPLLQGVLEKNVDGYKMLLERMQIVKSFNINVKDPRTGYTPLHHAAAKGKTGILTLLLERGADVNAVNKKGQTPLHLSIQNGHDDCCYKLINHNEIKVYLPDEELNTTFHIAVKEGRENICRAILARYETGGTKVFVTDCKNIKGKTPLHYAAGRNLKATVKLLLENGADPKKSDKYEYLPLHYAAEKGYDDCCKLLLTYTSKEVVERQLTTYTKTGKTPLILAAEGGFRKCCELMTFGINNQDQKKENTALHYAVKGGFQNTVKQLLDDGACPNIKNKRGCTPCHEAAEFSKLECLEYLIEGGGDIREVNSDGKNIFHLAAEKQRKDMVEFLCDREELQKVLPYVLNQHDKSKHTPLHLAIINRSEDIAMLLVEKGASPVEEAMDGKTSLHLAAQNKSLSLCIVFLSKYRIPINKENRKKETALHLAAQGGAEDICRFLIKKGTHVDGKDSNGRTALHIASESGNANVVRVLLKENANPDEPDGIDGSYPLHLAASAGSLECCKLLISRAKYISWKEDENELLPIDRAFRNRAQHGDNGNNGNEKESPANSEVFEFLLKNLRFKEDQEDQMLNIHQYMTESLEQNESKFMKSIIESEWWEAAIVGQNGYQCQNFRQLIRKHPDLALELMKRCVSTDKNKEVTYDFSLYEDNYYIGPKSDELAEDPFDPDTNKLLEEAYSYDKGFKWREKHPVTLMIKLQRRELLYHQLTEKWLQHKWKSLARWLFFFMLLVEFLFTLILGLFMAFVFNWPLLLMTEECRYTEERFCGLVYQELEMRWSEEYAREYGTHRAVTFDGDMGFRNCTRYVGLHLFLWSMLLIFIVITIALEVNNLIRLRVARYFKNRDHIVQILKVIFAILALIPWNGCEFHYVVLNDWRWDFGIIALLLSGFHLLFAINQVPGLTVFMPMTLSFLGGFILVWLYIATIVFIFAFIFHLLLRDQAPFMTIPQSMVKTIVWMIGDLAYDDTFLSDDHILHRPILTNILFIIFVTVLGSLLANFIISQPNQILKKYRDNALFHRVANRAELIMNLMVCFPFFTRGRIIKKYTENSSVVSTCCGRPLSKKLQKMFAKEEADQEVTTQTPQDAVQTQLEEMNNQLSASLTEIKSLKCQLTKLNQSQLELKNTMTTSQCNHEHTTKVVTHEFTKRTVP